MNLLWLPYEEQRLYRVLKMSRGEIFRWVRIDATHTLAQLGRRRGYTADRLAAALVAPRAGKVSSRTLRTLRRAARRTVTQGHLAQHFLFHALHQTAVPERSRWIFGVRTNEDWFNLRRAELSPLQIGELHGRTRTTMRRRVEQALRDAAAKGVRRGYLTDGQRDIMLDRQLRQVPRWLGQRRYNGPTGGRNRLKLPPGDTAKHPTVSADGSRVVWDAYRSRISDAERKGEIHVSGADVGASRRFPVSPAVRPGSRRPHSAYNAELSADGRFVAFETAASTFPLAKRVGQMSILVRDLRSGAVQKISHTARPKNAPTRTAFNPSISDDGRLVAYEATDSGTNGGPSRNGLWVFDRDAGTQRLIDEHGDQGAAYLPELTGDGTAVAYTAAGSAHGGRTLVYLRGLADGNRTLVSRASGDDGTAAASDAYEPSVSRDGTAVAFTSRATNLGGASRRSSVYVRDLRANTTRWISRGVAGDAVEPAISADGRYVAFVARAGFRGGTILSLRSNVWLHDRVTGRTTLVSRASGDRGAAGNGYASEPDVSEDGSLVAFASTSGNLVRGKARGLTGVFVRDVPGATTRLLSDHRAGGRAATDASAREPGSSWALCPLGPLTHGAA
ncbi:hypothetical protein LRS13_20945 [Svornostia abyssi]|uniref:Uncharacterized protein n=1 Tax=Svornostia abyssi TaxID=2898438 RepID=A0ABY5PEW6_9ACTN|nr:hypothetical protein LRS13_20945 [Parviterribacteraceae bacterium J379]